MGAIRTALTLVTLYGLVATAHADRTATLKLTLDAIKHRDAKAFAKLVVAPFEPDPPAWRSAACEKECHDHEWVKPERFGKLVACIDEFGLKQDSPDQFFLYEPSVQVVVSFSMHDPHNEKPDGLSALR